MVRGAWCVVPTRAEPGHGHCQLGRKRPDRTDLPEPRRLLKILQRRPSASLAFTDPSCTHQPLSVLSQLPANCPALSSARTGSSPGTRHRRRHTRVATIAMLYRPSERWVPIVQCGPRAILSAAAQPPRRLARMIYTTSFCQNQGQHQGQHQPRPAATDPPAGTIRLSALSPAPFLSRDLAS